MASDQEKTIIRTEDDVDLAVFVSGKGDSPLLFIHGWCLHHEFWNYQLPELVDEFRIYTYDQRGHGESSGKGPDRFSLEKIGQDLRSVVDHIFAETGQKVFIVGHSMGAMAIGAYAQHSAEHLNEHASGLLLANTAFARIPALTKFVPFGLSRVPLLQKIALAVLKNSTQLEDTSFLSRLNRRYYTRLTWYGPENSELSDQAFGQSKMVPPPVRAAALKEMLAMDLRPALKNIQRPTTVLVSQNDRLTPAVAGEEIGEILAQQGYLHSFVSVDPSGHNSPLNQIHQFTSYVRDCAREARIFSPPHLR